MPEYFTSLAAGIAGGPFDRQDPRRRGSCQRRARDPVLSVLGCYGNEGTRGSEVKSEGTSSAGEAKFTHIRMRITFDV